MTLWVYSSVNYIMCVLDSEGQRMGLDSYTWLWDCLKFYLQWRDVLCGTVISKTQILHIRGGRSLEMWTCSHGSASASTFAGGRSKKGSAPSSRHCRMRPLSFTSQPNLNLTMEPAQYACNPIHEAVQTWKHIWFWNLKKKRKKKCFTEW